MTDSNNFLIYFRFRGLRWHLVDLKPTSVKNHESCQVKESSNFESQKEIKIKPLKIIILCLFKNHLLVESEYNAIIILFPYSSQRQS